MAERQKKTAEQRATETLGIAQRAHDKATAKLKTAREAVTALEAEQSATADRLAYVGIHPDLPEEVRAQYVVATIPVASEDDGDGSHLTEGE